MRIYIVIPAHNEELFISKTLRSLVNQTLLPKRIIVVNDNSTDATEDIVNNFIETSNLITQVLFNSSEDHMPGSKVIKAFNEGYKMLDAEYDIICKFDADLIFPLDYLEKIANHFRNNTKTGMVGGFCYIQKGENWILENLTNKDHIRGALKAYRKQCFVDIKGLRPAMGWDTIDELVAQYNKWTIKTISSLHVKHLKPTGNTYNDKAKYKQGEAFYRMRYGFCITLIASVKLALLKQQPLLVKNYLIGFFIAKRQNQPFLVSKEEGQFIRSLRWKKIKQKFF